jgi:carboxymethylenebutenolidase
MKTMNGHWIDIKASDGATFGAYVSTPPKGTGPGIILIQEIWGVNQHIRDVADQYAMDGFTVFAPDVFFRQQPRVDLGYNDVDNPKAYGFMGALDRPLAVKDLTCAAQALRAHAGVSGKIASVGFCMGGALSYGLAAAGAVDAAVCYYGGGIQTMLDRAPNITVPILFHYAENDGHIPMSAVDSVKAAFAGRENARVDVYGGVDHGFNCWGRTMYNQKVAALARGRTLSFLSKTIA